MYTLTDGEGNKFKLGRPHSEINDVIGEFANDLTKELLKFNGDGKLKVLKEILEIITLCEESTTKKYYEIERLIQGVNLPIVSLYFTISKKVKTKNNELIEATPQLFDVSDTSYFYTFLTAIKYTIVSELRSLEQPHLGVLTAPEEKKRGFTKNQVAMAVRYQQIAGSREDFKDGEKEREIQKIASQYKISPDTLQKAYNSISKSGAIKQRLTILKYGNNKDAISKLLQGDSKALNQLRLDIAKITDPLS